MINNLVLMGRLSKDPELKTIGETNVCNFDIAVDNKRKESDGTRSTSFFPVVCFGVIAENVAEHLVKGSKVAVQGSIEQRTFMKKDGSKGYSYEVVATSVEFLDSKKSIDETAEPDKEEEKPKYDPYTGKPLGKSSKK